MSKDPYILKLTSEVTKQVDDSWSAGNNEIYYNPQELHIDELHTDHENDDWYHVFIIKKDTDYE